MSTTGTTTPQAAQACFVTTHWSVVITAADNDSPQAQAALSRLCETYWYPLYAYVRRRGHSPEDAQDLTQEFFARLLAQHWVADADRGKGRFRTFLLTALNRFLANDWDRVRAHKRGGGVPCVPLDTDIAEARYQSDAAYHAAPYQLYDRQWALTLLERALNRLSAEYAALKKSAEFEILSPLLTAERGAIPYDQVATRLELSETAARQTVHRFRKRFRECFREEIVQTVGPEEVDEEIRYLLAAVAV